MTYTSDSYASMYMPEKTLFQPDARIFYQSGYLYDYVESVEDVSCSEKSISASLNLRSGEHAHLLLTLPSNDAVRLRLWLGDVSPDDCSFMLVPQVLESEWIAHSHNNTLNIQLANYTIIINKKPFQISAYENTNKTLIFELENERVAGQPITGALGFRKKPDNTGTLVSEAFISWRIHNGEQYFGLGEKWNKVEKTSTRATVWACDTAGTNTTDMSYKSVPLIYSTAGWGMFLHSGYRSFWEVGTFSYTAGAAMVETASLDVFLFFSPSLKGLIGKYTDLTGKPNLPPKWAFGLWMSRCAYPSRQVVNEVLSRLRSENIPVDVVHLDPAWMKTHYYSKLGVDACDFDWNYESWGTPEEAFDDISRNRVKICLWINPYLPEGHPIYEEAKSKGYLVKSLNGDIARLEFGEPVGVVDITNPEAKEWWKEHLRVLLRAGASVLKPDYGDRVSEDSLFFNGKSGKEMHSPFLHLYSEAAYQATQEVTGEGLVWRRAGYIGSQRYPGTWAGDTQISWEGMQGALRGGLSAGFSGEAFWSHDMGGFVGEKPSAELYIRWSQFGLFSPFSRYHGTQPREPWEYGDKALEIVRHYVNLRYSLVPYLLACSYEAHQLGLPLQRHMKLEFEDHPGTEGLDSQFMLGGDLLVAPIMKAGVSSRQVYFPKGTWTALENQQHIYQGPCFHEVDTPLEYIPVFVRPGSIVPRYIHPPQNLQEAVPSEMALDIYPGDSRRSLTIKENGYELGIHYESKFNHGHLIVDPAPVKITTHLINSKAMVSVINEKYLYSSVDSFTIDAATGASIDIIFQ